MRARDMLPDCMMPDGAEPCLAYQAEQKTRDELLAALRAVVAIADEAFLEWDRDNDPRVGKILNALAGRIKGYRQDIDAIHNALAKAEGRQS